MILTIDVGNTDTVFAFYKTDKIVENFRVPTKPYKDKQEYIAILQGFRKKVPSVEGVIIASVVPVVKDSLFEASYEVFEVLPLLLGNDDVKIDLKVKIDKPKSLGADRVANSIAAIKKFGKNVIVIDFGTATTFEIVGNDNDYIGGVIAPGINTSIRSLHEAAALLPMYEVKRPKKVIATCLDDALHSGIFYGSLGMINFLVENIKRELKEDFKVISTGGLGGLFTEYTEGIDAYEPDLTTFGLLQIYNFNKNNL